jgi:two-component system sensor histidine kinase SenX3
MVELSTGTAVAVAAGGGALVLLLAVLLVHSVRRWRSASRRLTAVAARLEPPGAPPPDDRDVVGRVERLAQGAVLRLSDADARADRLGGALGAVGVGVVVCDEAGDVFHDGAGEVAAGGAVAGSVRAVLAAAVEGRPAERTVDVPGPPPRSLRVTGRPVDDGRRVVGGVAVIDDVTEHRRFDAVRRDFLANLTAELKAPLGALGLLAGTIVAEDDPALTRRLAARLEADALRVGRMVDDLAELSRLESIARPAREPVSVHLVVAQAVERAVAAAPGRAVSVDAATAPAGVAVAGDRRQLVSALGHLVENAVTAAGDEGSVRVKVTAGAEWVDVAVADDGPGIPAAELDRVFEAFYRTGDARQRSAAGTGLGLAIASRVAAAAGGEVLASSQVGRGSTFTLRLPAAAADDATGSGEAAARREAG